jgi:glucokinase
MAMPQPQRAGPEKWPESVIVADIGGTNARFAVASLATLGLSATRQFLCAEHPSLAVAVAAYLDGLQEAPRHAAFAVAGPVTGEDVSFTNSTWSISREELRGAAGLEQLHILNDFEALALSLPYLAGEDLVQIGGGEPAPRGTKLVLGPGTGIGVAGLVWSPWGWVAVPSEGGHISLAARDQHEFDLASRLRAGRDRISVERALSGPGLAALYGAVPASQGASIEAVPPSEVLKRAKDGADAIAIEALETFIAWLGAFAGDAALLFGARGGVYLGGGIAPKLLEEIASPAFRQAFEAKGRMQSFLAPIPVYVIRAEFAALTGAAAALRAELARGGDGAPALT